MLALCKKNGIVREKSRRKFDYSAICEKALELQDLKATAKHFNCNVETVKKALRENNIFIKGIRPRIAMLDAKNKTIVKIFNSQSAAQRFLGNCGANSNLKNYLDTDKIYHGYLWQRTYLTEKEN